MREIAVVLLKKDVRATEEELARILRPFYKWCDCGPKDGYCIDPNCPKCDGFGYQHGGLVIGWDYYDVFKMKDIPPKHRRRPDVVVDLDGIWHDFESGLMITPVTGIRYNDIYKEPKELIEANLALCPGSKMAWIVYHS